jgi:hypothetical protein
MVTFDADQIIKAASERVLTDEELDAAEAWAKSFEGVTLNSDDQAATQAHPLITFVQRFVKGGPSPLFSANFKLLNKRVMPYVVAAFKV